MRFYTNAKSADIADQYSISPNNLKHYYRIIDTLTQETKTLLKRGFLSFGHAKALCKYTKKEQKMVAGEAIAKNLTCRALEAKKLQTATLVSDYYEKLSGRMSELTGHPCTVVQDTGKHNAGEIRIRYADFTQFDSIITDLLRIDPESLQ